MAVDKKMQEWIDRQEGYREWNKTHDSYKIIYSPTNTDEHGNRINYKKSIQKTYDELSKPVKTYSETLQNKLEPITSHPAMGRKEPKVQTLEQEKEEWDFCMDQADHDTMLRREMARIRKEWKAKGWKEEGVTDTHKVVYEAEKRVSQMAKKDINKYHKDSHERIGGEDNDN